MRQLEIVEGVKRPQKLHTLKKLLCCRPLSSAALIRYLFIFSIL